MTRVDAADQTRERTNELAALAKAGDADAWIELVRVLRPPIVSRLRRLSISYSAHDLEDLNQAAQLGIAEAIDRFESGPAANFGAFAWNRIRSEISRWLAANSGAISMPYESWRLGQKINDALPGQRPEDKSHAALKKETGINLAPEIIRARQNSVPLDELSTEDVTGERDAATLALVEQMYGRPESEARRMALQFCELWDLDWAVADNLVVASKRRRSWYSE